MEILKKLVEFILNESGLGILISWISRYCGHKKSSRRICVKFESVLYGYQDQEIGITGIKRSGLRVSSSGERKIQNSDFSSGGRVHNYKIHPPLHPQQNAPVIWYLEHEGLVQGLRTRRGSRLLPRLFLSFFNEKNQYFILH